MKQSLKPTKIYILAFLILGIVQSCNKSYSYVKNRNNTELINQIKTDIYENYSYYAPYDSIREFKTLYKKKEDFNIIVVPNIYFSDKMKKEEFDCNDEFMDWIDFDNLNYDYPLVFLYDKKGKFIAVVGYNKNKIFDIDIRADVYHIYAKKFLTAESVFLLNTELDSDQLFILKNQDGFFTFDYHEMISVNQFGRIQGKERINDILNGVGIIIGGDGYLSCP